MIFFRRPIDLFHDPINRVNSQIIMNAGMYYLVLKQ